MKSRGPSQNIVITFGVLKIKMVWLPDGEKNEDTCTRFVTDTQPRRTDERTPRDGIGRAYV